MLFLYGLYGELYGWTNKHDEQTRQKLGRVIAALRQQTINHQTARSYSQPKFAEAANISLKTLRNIEQGKKAHVDASTLTQIANALRLTLLERETLSSLPTAINSADVVRTQKAPHVILKEWEEELRDTPFPAVLYDPFYNVITINRIGLMLHGIKQALLDEWIETYGALNTLMFVFHPDSPLRQAMHDVWERFAILHVHQFRAMVLRYRHTAYFKHLFQQLCKLKDFYRIWTEIQWHEDDFDTSLKTYGFYCHPQHGDLCYRATVTERVTPTGRLYLSTLLPKNIGTANTFDQLQREHGSGIQRLTPWPHPALCPDAESMYSG